MTNEHGSCAGCGSLIQEFYTIPCDFCLWENKRIHWHPAGTIPEIDPTQLIAKEIPCKAGAVPNAAQTISQSL